MYPQKQKDELTNRDLVASSGTRSALGAAEKGRLTKQPLLKLVQYSPLVDSWELSAVP